MSNHAPAEADDQYMAVQATPEFQALQGLSWIARATLERAAGHSAASSSR